MADRYWVAEECASRVADSFEEQTILIDFGLGETALYGGVRVACGWRATWSACLILMLEDACLILVLEGACLISTHSQTLHALPETLSHLCPHPSGLRCHQWRRGGGSRAVVAADEAVDAAPPGQARHLICTSQGVSRVGHSSLAVCMLTYTPDASPPHPCKRSVFSAAAYAAFKDADLPEAARQYAAAGDVPSLVTLVQRHPAALGPGVMGVLEALPESMDPRLYAQLLPRVSERPATATAV